MERMRAMRRISIVLALTAFAALWASPAQAQTDLAGCGASGGYEVCFNDPSSPVQAQHQVLFRRLRKLIDAAGSGDQINVAMFTWTKEGRKVTDALVAAKRRGAAVSVVVDNTADGEQKNALRAGGVELTVCKRSCTSHEKGSILHAKLFLLRIGGRKHTVVSTSNLTGRQRDELANDFVHTSADDELYDYLYAYWFRLRIKNWFFLTPSARVKRTAAGNTAYLFDRDADDDPVVRILRSVKRCTKGHAKVYVAMALFTRPRVQKALRFLRKRRKCNVRIVIDPKNATGGVDEAFAQKGLADGRVRKWPVHHKLLIIDAQIGRRLGRVVYTGSHNFTKPALSSHDEIWVGFRNPFVVNTYLGYFDRLFARAAR